MYDKDAHVQFSDKAISPAKIVNINNVFVPLIDEVKVTKVEHRNASETQKQSYGDVSS